MNQVIGRLDPVQSRVEARPVEDITRDDFRGWTGLLFESFRMPGEAAHAMSLALQRAQEVAANVPGGACEKNEGVFR